MEELKLKRLCCFYEIPVAETVGSKGSRSLAEHVDMLSKEVEMYKQLSLCLARDHVDAFRERDRGGRPRKWTPSSHARLVFEMSTLVAEQRGKTWAAMTLLARQPRWKDMVTSKGNRRDVCKALVRQYDIAMADPFTQSIVRDLSAQP